MTDATKLARIKPILGYGAFSVFALLFFLYVTFPYETVRQRLQLEASAAGLNLTIASMGPGLFGITAKGIRVNRVLTPEAQRVAAETGTPEPTPLEISSVALRPSLFPPGLAVRANALDGTLSGVVSPLGSTSVRLSADNLDLSKGNLSGFTGLDLSGRLSADLKLKLPTTSSGPNRPAEPDLGLADGYLNLELANGMVNGGTVTVPMMGTPTPVSLPKIDLGSLDGQIEFEKGLGKVEKLATTSPDLELGATGTLKLAKRFEYSEPALDVRLKANPEFVKRLGLIGSGLSMLPADKDPSYRAFKIRGFLGRPDFPDFRRR